jgi:hypothetical protein
VRSFARSRVRAFVRSSVVVVVVRAGSCRTAVRPACARARRRLDRVRRVIGPSRRTTHIVRQSNGVSSAGCAKNRRRRVVIVPRRERLPTSSSIRARPSRVAHPHRARDRHGDRRACDGRARRARERETRAARVARDDANVDGASTSHPALARDVSRDASGARRPVVLARDDRGRCRRRR